ncbi:MAG: thiamine pyrophosphate-dependent dehydrogenase E1 component subunit alpha [Candidatus Tantalella remota]|nr:thiamine pyrophosphate-dependent dehydrogenase E1 component subunit alpha [Candidatus Tantalella remota]
MRYSNVFLKKMYEKMVQIRVCEESLVEPILNEEVKCPVHLYSGEEAVAVGVCAALKKKDYVFGTHRSHGHFLAKGGKVEELIAEIYGKTGGCSGGRGGSMHLIDTDNGMLGAAPIVAGTIPLALGAALASKIRKDGRVVVSFFGDGATGEGVLFEALNFAALKNLPIIFVCENNLYSTHMPIRSIRTNNEIYRIGEPFDIKSYRVDGNDVIKVFEIAEKAVKRCRKVMGPVFMECLTYRFRGHVGADDNVQGKHTDIRPAAEIKEWHKRDPIKRYERCLLKNKIVNSDELRKCRERIAEKIKKAFEFSSRSPMPREEELLDNVFRK